MNFISVRIELARIVKTEAPKSKNNRRDQDMKKTSEHEYAFLISKQEQIPPDFALDINFDKIDFAIFLPQDQCGRLRKPHYPARILFLFPDMLTIATRFSDDRSSCVSLPLNEIVTMGLRQIRRQGSIVIETTDSRHEWPYDTCAEGTVARFMLEMRSTLLTEKVKQPNYGRSIFGEPLDHKFGWAEADNLDRGEVVVARFFSAPNTVKRKKWIFESHLQVPGDYVALTSHRILWITDRFDGVYQESGIGSVYAPLRNSTGIELKRGDLSSELEISFHINKRWLIPIQLDFYDEAEAFAKQINKLLSRRETAQQA